jgi:hypothetical protein
LLDDFSSPKRLRIAAADSEAADVADKKAACPDRPGSTSRLDDGIVSSLSFLPLQLLPSFSARG